MTIETKDNNIDKVLDYILYVLKNVIEIVCFRKTVTIYSKMSFSQNKNIIYYFISIGYSFYYYFDTFSYSLHLNDEIPLE